MKTEYWDYIISKKPKLKGDCLRILIYLSVHEKASVSTIADTTGISKSHVSEFCKEMWDAGLLERKEMVKLHVKYVIYSINWEYRPDI